MVEFLEFGCWGRWILESWTQASYLRVAVGALCFRFLRFALLGAFTACLSALLSVVRTGLSIKTRSRTVAYIFIVMTLAIGLYFADVWYDLFPIIGTCIGTYALYCLSGIKMRLAFLCGALCWLTNNIIVGSIGGTMLEATLLMVNSFTIWRLYILKKAPVTN